MNALIAVDLQNDFVPGGALAVPQGDQVVPIVNRLMPRFDLVVATQDWHPPNHGSFASQHPGRTVGDLIDLNGLQQILWPDHCVQNTPGADLLPALDTSHIDRIFHKGTDPRIDSYSAFFDNAHRKSTGLSHYLKQRRASDLYIVGLATDYCVKFTTLDARQLGFNTTVILEAVRGVDLNPGDCQRALTEMQAAGVSVIHQNEL